jgi:hypothetical protein
MPLSGRTEEEIICIRTEAANAEYLNHVKELPVDITNHGDRRRNVYHIALLHKKLFGFGAYCFDHRVCQQFFLVESRDALIEIDGSFQ